MCDKTTALVAGNTNAATFRSRSFLFTIFDMNRLNDFINEFKRLKTCDYGVAALETCPTTGKQHAHLYVHFTESYKLSKVILSYKNHADICRGSPKQNIEYVCKDGNKLDEWGIEPHQGQILSAAELKKIPQEEVPWMMYNTWQKLNMNDEIEIDNIHKQVKVYYIYGPSGVGKTTRAIELIKEYGQKNQITTFSQAKYENSFWVNVGSKRKILLYDDFRDSHMRASEFINLIDYNRHPMNTKGSSCMNDYELIIITSVQDPNYIYSSMGDEPRKQWLRRMEIINMEPQEEEPEILIPQEEEDFDTWFNSFIESGK